ncbi:hypothetical protein Gohar_025014 [Gossypium harknessii]|uniref:Uncharacterized protein n=1 Tax=Gossypium harknessii TaxID=34285 RepID=A0A7J9HHV2_9ROSI|nr:hypothetical protein [Gossypium harknessii]
MDRGCGSILELWDVTRYLKLNCGSFWTSISYNSSSLEPAKEGQDTSHCPEANAFALNRLLNPPPATQRSIFCKDSTGTVGDRLKSLPFFI